MFNINTESNIMLHVKNRSACHLIILLVCMLIFTSSCTEKSVDHDRVIVPVAARNCTPIEKLLIMGRNASSAFYKVVSKSGQKQTYDFVIKEAKAGEWQDLTVKRDVKLVDDAYLMISIVKKDDAKFTLQIGATGDNGTFILEKEISLDTDKVQGVDLLAERVSLDEAEIALAHLTYTSSEQNTKIVSYALQAYLDKPVYKSDEYLFLLRRSKE